MLKKVFVVLLICSNAVSYLWGQDYSAKLDSIFSNKIIYLADSMPDKDLEEVVVYAPRIFEKKRDYKRYRKLVKKIKKVYPYAKTANQWLTDINNNLEKIESEREKKVFIKQAEKRLRSEFEDELIKLTFSEGRLLIKLIDRETGNTSYELVKQLRGSFSAFFWQSVALLFGSNLKSEYDAENDDRLIEEIIYQIDNGFL